MNGWRVGLSVDPASASFDDDVRVRIVLTNVSAHEDEIADYDSHCGFQLAVTDIRSQEVLKSGCFRAKHTFRAIPIGTTIVETFSMRDVHARDTFARLIGHPGQYEMTVVAVMTRYENGRLRPLRVKSNTALLTIDA